MLKALSLNFDNTFFPTPETPLAELIDTLSLEHLSENIRYSASWKEMNLLEKLLLEHGAFGRPIYFMGNGDFHHLSYLTIKHFPRKKLHVVVFDNHPDNMIFPWGIHCGSWIYHAAQLSHVHTISVIGITSPDINWKNLWQNNTAVLKSGKVRYYVFRPITPLLKPYAIDIREKDFLIFLGELVEKINLPIFFSLDKDVLNSNELKTGWDQGVMSINTLTKVLDLIPFTSRLVGFDCVGDPSIFKFNGFWKKILRKIDGIDNQLDASSAYEHVALNTFLLQKILHIINI